MTIKKNDIVASRGRIKTIQDDHQRFISFTDALVLEVSEAGITVNPMGMQAIVICQPEDLEPPTLEQTPASRQSAKEIAQAAKPAPHPEPEPEAEPAQPEGSIAVSGEVAEEAEAEPKAEGIAATRKRRRR